MSSSSRQENADHIEIIMSAVRAQVRRDVDQIRARIAWSNILEKIPHESIAQALAMALACGTYEERPQCRCCLSCRP